MKTINFFAATWTGLPHPSLKGRPWFWSYRTCGRGCGLVALRRWCMIGGGKQSAQTDAVACEERR